MPSDIHSPHPISSWSPPGFLLCSCTLDSCTKPEAIVAQARDNINLMLVPVPGALAGPGWRLAVLELAEARPCGCVEQDNLLKLSLLFCSSSPSLSHFVTLQLSWKDLVIEAVLFGCWHVPMPQERPQLDRPAVMLKRNVYTCANHRITSNPHWLGRNLKTLFVPSPAMDRVTFHCPSCSKPHPT